MKISRKLLSTINARVLVLVTPCLGQTYHAAALVKRCACSVQDRMITINKEWCYSDTEQVWVAERAAAGALDHLDGRSIHAAARL